LTTARVCDDEAKSKRSGLLLRACRVRGRPAVAQLLRLRLRVRLTVRVRIGLRVKARGQGQG
jgi:hypothetical protein